MAAGVTGPPESNVVRQSIGQLEEEQRACLSTATISASVGANEYVQRRFGRVAGIDLDRGEACQVAGVGVGQAFRQSIGTEGSFEPGESGERLARHLPVDQDLSDGFLVPVGCL